jgi:hypothetical protein
MAKSNREAKKPKKDKVKIIAAAPSQKGARLRAGSHRSDQAKRNRTHGSFDESRILTSASSVSMPATLPSVMAVPSIWLRSSKPLPPSSEPPRRS